MEAYDETCAYSGLRLHRDAFTVDHYLPVSRIWGKNPELAYDWNNFRLASRHMNTEKRDFTDVLDPFEIPPQSFEIVFPSMLIKAGPALSPSDKAKVNATIKRLKLNTKEEYKDHRRKLILKYCKFAKKSSIGAALDYLDSHAPYIVDELKRQKLTKKILQMVIISPRANKNNILP
ncbi:MAG: hypothetical protein GY940_43890 [bacterium]|nr:hypothetical protein [bacterium]